MNKVYLLFLIPLLFFCSCVHDLGTYSYLQTPEVEFAGITDFKSQYTAGDLIDIDAPILFSEKVSRPDEDFTIEWYLDRKLIHTGMHLKYELAGIGPHELILKVRHKSSGKTYLSDKYSINARNPFDWGWMILYDGGDGRSSLGFITPDLKAYAGAENNIPGGLGQDPRSLAYYYVLGTIPGSYVSGIPKVLINQGSGSVTLDGNTLQKDMLLADEFEQKQEPLDLSIRAFAFKETYYVLYTSRGEVYIRGVDRKHKKIPYYGSYKSIPLEIEGGAKITHFNPFTNVSFQAANTKNCLLYDELHGRFLRLTEAPFRGRTDFPELVYLKTYDQEAQIAPGTPRVDAMGAGTKCLASGAYEKKDLSGPYGAITYRSRYVTLMQPAGGSDTNLFLFDVVGDDNKRHRITWSEQYPFAGSSLLSARSVILMSGDLEKHPFIYFTDGGNRLYAYSMDARSYRMIYTASDRITTLSASPLSSPFFEFGQGNDPIANFRLAVADASGQVAVLNVSGSSLVSTFEGKSPETLVLKKFQGYGSIKGMVWCTNFQGEF